MEAEKREKLRQVMTGKLNALGNTVAALSDAAGIDASLELTVGGAPMLFSLGYTVNPKSCGSESIFLSTQIRGAGNNIAPGWFRTTGAQVGVALLPNDSLWCFELPSARLLVWLEMGAGGLQVTDWIERSDGSAARGVLLPLAKLKEWRLLFGSEYNLKGVNQG